MLKVSYLIHLFDFIAYYPTGDSSISAQCWRSSLGTHLYKYLTYFILFFLYFYPCYSDQISISIAHRTCYRFQQLNQRLNPLES